MDNGRLKWFIWVRTTQLKPQHLGWPFLRHDCVWGVLSFLLSGGQESPSLNVSAERHTSGDLGSHDSPQLPGNRPLQVLASRVSYWASGDQKRLVKTWNRCLGKECYVWQRCDGVIDPPSGGAAAWMSPLENFRPQEWMNEWLDQSIKQLGSCVGAVESCRVHFYFAVLVIASFLCPWLW